MVDLFSNPELIRNARAQLRWGRMLAAAAVCVVLSVSIAMLFAFSIGEQQPASEWGMKFLQTIFVIQAVVLMIVGALMCLTAVHREKELNTFDFQRVTRLTPLELGLGKLFGAPVMAYFVFVCFLPAAIFGAAVGRARPSFVIAAYAMLLLGAVMTHAMALMFSIFIPKGTSSGALMLLLLFILPSFVAPTGNSREFFDIGSTTPIAAVSLLDEKSWSLETKRDTKTGVLTSAGEFTDVFFGLPLHHVPVALLIYTSFIVWFLVPVVRNIKRDPAVYAAFTPIQMLGLLFYFNFLLIGFYRWQSTSTFGVMGQRTPLDIQTMFLAMNFAMFLATGFVLIHNRDHVRRRIRELGNAATNVLAALWPGTYVAVGVLLVGLAVVGLAQLHYAESKQWGITFALFRLVFIAVWLARDLLYLQWMNLRIGKRPLAMGLLFLIVFYTCVSILFATFDMFDTPEKLVWTAVALPVPFFTSSLDNWTLYEAKWLGMLAAQLAQVGLFAYLHRRKLLELAPLAAPAVTPPPALDAPPAPETGNVPGIGS